MFKRSLSKEEKKKLRSEYFRIEGNNLLKAVSTALNEAGITFWLEFGTLLGYYREHDFIPHDFDLDFGAFINDADKIRKTLTSNGIKLLRVYTDNNGGIEECYIYKHTTFDIFYFKRTENGLACSTYTRAPKSWIRSLLNRRKFFVKEVSIPDNGFVHTEFKGCSVNVPADCEIHLKAHYGESFMTPDPNFDYKSVATNIRYFTPEERISICKYYGTL